MARGTPIVVPVRTRDGVTGGQANALVAALDIVPWSHLSHAYGSASDAPALLYAATVGDAETRKAAWWELWGNVHHQGTVYSASAAAVPLIGAIAESDEHPDRVQALSFLRSLALGDGEHAQEVRSAVQPYAAGLVERLPQEPDLVRRAVAWLASAYPALVTEHPELADLVPDEMRVTWSEVLDRVAHGRDDDADDDAALDREDDLERWLLAGCAEPADDPR